MLPQPSSTPSRSDNGAPTQWRVRIGELWIDALTFDEAIGTIDALVSAGNGGSVFTPNVDHVVTAEDDESFRAAYRAADLAVPDGQPLIWASRLLGTPLPQKISGSDLVWPLMALAAHRRWRVYLLGAGPGVAARAAERMVAELGVNVVGVDAPAVSLDSQPAEPDPSVERVREAKPHVLLVALGAPKQERWIHRNAAQIRPAVALGVGAALDFLAGRLRRAPPWMSRMGLEWLFRMSQDPRRLARRYLLKDPRLASIVARELFTRKRFRLEERETGEGRDSSANAPTGS